jgi:hypothetical protein
VGIVGIEGPIGPRGVHGERGAKGERGEAGEVGEIGSPGPDGPRGADGKAGPAGPLGPLGPAGRDVVFYRLMTAQWISQHAVFYSKSTSATLRESLLALSGKATSASGKPVREKVFGVHIVDRGTLVPSTPYVISMRIAARPAVGKDRLFFGISDGTHIAGVVRTAEGTKLVHQQSKPDDGRDWRENGKVLPAPEEQGPAVEAVPNGDPKAGRGDGARRVSRGGGRRLLADEELLEEGRDADADANKDEAKAEAKAKTPTAEARGIFPTELKDGIEEGVLPRWFNLIVRVDPVANTLVIVKERGRDVPVLDEVPFRFDPSQGISIVSVGADESDSYTVYAIDATIYAE